MRPRHPRAIILRALARIADANANRAREGFRVVEDLFRLGLEDREASEKLKALRRGVTRVCDSSALRRLRLLSSRDAVGDPGGGSRVEGGRKILRRGLSALVAANLRRSQESLRVLEETDRVLGGNGTGFRKLRFQAYEAEAKFLPRILRSFPK